MPDQPSREAVAAGERKLIDMEIAYEESGGQFDRRRMVEFIAEAVLAIERKRWEEEVRERLSSEAAVQVGWRELKGCIPPYEGDVDRLLDAVSYVVFPSQEREGEER
jgi:uncharacterized caspase-like protein